jgi:preprotein translocase subunit SecE
MIQKIKEFFREVSFEFKKVVFPSREELIGSTWVVIIAVIIVAIFLGIVDIVLAKIVERLLR